jgi:large subunit ribosomal protein L23
MENSKIILQKPKSTEKIVRMIEAENVLAFVTDRGANKADIRKEMEDLFEVKVENVRTLIRNNKKIAYIKLKSEFPAIDVATKLGLM